MHSTSAEGCADARDMGGWLAFFHFALWALVLGVAVFFIALFQRIVVAGFQNQGAQNIAWDGFCWV